MVPTMVQICDVEKTVVMFGLVLVKMKSKLWVCIYLEAWHCVIRQLPANNIAWKELQDDGLRSSAVLIFTQRRFVGSLFSA